MNQFGARLLELAEIVAGVLAPVMEAQWALITAIVGAAVDVIGVVLSDVINISASVIDLS